MSDGQDKVFFQCDTGEWAFGTEKQFAESAAATGTRIKLVVAPMAYGEFCRRIPNLAARMSGDCTFVRGAPEHACQTKNFRFAEVGGLRVAVADHGADKKCAEDFDIRIGPLSAAMTPDQIAEAVLNDAQWLDREALSEHLGISRSTFYRKVAEGQIEVAAVAGRRVYRPRIDVYRKEDADVGPSYDTGAAVKLGRIIETAYALQAKMDAPGHEVHRLRTELADLRAKLRYASVRMPQGFWQVEGLVSSVKGRETPGHQDRAAYLDGARVPHATDALPGPHGFIIAGRDRAVFNGVVHVFEMDPGRAWQPWPESLTFSVNA